MNTDHEPKNPRRLALALGTLMFTFMSVVSLVIFYTEERRDLADCLLIVGAPFAMAMLAYLVGLYHDPNASD